MKVKNGWVEGADKIISPNFNERPDNTLVSLLVIHNISLPPNCFDNEYVEQFFQNRLPANDHPYFAEIASLQVSSHFYIKRNGKLIQFVSCDDRAWHAGKSSYCGVQNCNDYSIGIELQGADDLLYTEDQYRVLQQLTKAIIKAYPSISAERIAGHSDIAPTRKTDPGPAFNWEQYLSNLD